MNESQQIREQVSSAYARAVCAPEPRGGSCCSPAQKGVVVKLAGYSREELASLPSQAVVNSFGCGNPLAFSEVREGDVVLDLGSGAGIDLLLAGKKVGPTGRAIGIDMTEEMIARAEANIALSGLSNVEVRKGIIEELPVESASVDWVISNCVINLSPEKPRVFSEIARVLKPGGRMLVADIVVSDLPEFVRKDKALYSSCVAGAVSENEYLAGLRRAGLTNVEVRERIIYDAAQLRDFVQSELEDSKAADDGGTGCVEPDEPKRTASTGCGDGGAATRFTKPPSTCCEAPELAAEPRAQQGAELTGEVIGEHRAQGGAQAAVDLAAETLAHSLVGKVWSAKFYAEKPGD